MHQRRSSFGWPVLPQSTNITISINRVITEIGTHRGLAGLLGGLAGERLVGALVVVVVDEPRLGFFCRGCNGATDNRRRRSCGFLS